MPINKHYIIKPNASCKEAMKLLDENEIKILFIVENNILLAALTDGDIRRYLLSGGQLLDPSINAGKKNPQTASNLNEAKRLIDNKSYLAIPIVNQGGELIDLFFGFTERIYKPIPNIQVVINAGGKGTRLDPFTKVLPKPLIPVGELPIIEHIMEEYKKYGANDFSIIVNYKKELIKAYFKDDSKKYLIKWYDEDIPLGTGGGLTLLRGQIKDTFFFTNCDILVKGDYESMLRYHKEHNNTITMVCAYKNITIPYGVVEVGNNGSITGMKEKPELSFLTNTGMYIVEPQVLENMEDGVSIGFPDVIKNEQKKGNKVGVYPVGENEWMDMGQLEELEKMRIKLYGK